MLTGSPITDMKITLLTGRAHEKHTEGGDFRQATYRAVRQGLMQAESLLLEPWYDLRLEVPLEQVGRAMTDLEQRFGSCQIAETGQETAVLTGSAPVSTLWGYQTELAAYTGGRGRLSCTVSGYQPCHNAEEVVAAAGYQPEADLANTPDSVFCAHGAGFVVNWRQVGEYMHPPLAVPAAGAGGGSRPHGGAGQAVPGGPGDGQGAGGHLRPNLRPGEAAAGL
ncbi:MAG: hypothetical protein LUD82_09175 [Clostridiales bacterium]|nr:hypothetical protein [Clostridiales bacterium]